MTVPPIVDHCAVGRAASGRWWWSYCRPACAAYRSGYQTEHDAQRAAYQHEREHR